MARRRKVEEEFDIYASEDLEFIDEEEDGYNSDEVGFMRGYLDEDS